MKNKNIASVQKQIVVLQDRKNKLATKLFPEEHFTNLEDSLKKIESELVTLTKHSEFMINLACDNSDPVFRKASGASAEATTLVVNKLEETAGVLNTRLKEAHAIRNEYLETCKELKSLQYHYGIAATLLELANNDPDRFVIEVMEASKAMGGEV